jgi:hypothetical protein
LSELELQIIQPVAQRHTSDGLQFRVQILFRSLFEIFYFSSMSMQISFIFHF